VRWCYACGRELRRGEGTEIEVPCPYCTVDVRVVLCPKCAKELVEKIRGQLEGMEHED